MSKRKPEFKPANMAFGVDSFLFTQSLPDMEICCPSLNSSSIKTDNREIMRYDSFHLFHPV